MINCMTRSCGWVTELGENTAKFYTYCPISSGKNAISKLYSGFSQVYEIARRQK
jgi:ribosomal protein L20A (L18A)